MEKTPNKYTTKEKILRILFILFLLPLAYYAAWCGNTIYNLSAERSALMKDYTDVNNIHYGLLSVDRWRDNVIEIVDTQIEEFEFSQDLQDSLRKELTIILNSMLNKGDRIINEKQTSVGGKVKKFAFNIFINTDKIRDRVPELSQTIIDQVKKPESQARLKYIAHTKLMEFAAQTRDTRLQASTLDSILAKYNVSTTEAFNNQISGQAGSLKQRSYYYTFIMIGIMLFFLLMWIVFRKTAVFLTPLFTLSVLLALIFLLTGLAAPMIEIDARIQEINFLLIGKNIQFQDQVLFYQSKSIIDVVKILIGTGKADSILVGILILAFSILFPICKLLSTKVYLLGSEKWRNNKIVKFFAFKSGKWSMADVMVVAIFMAYIGFKGILDSELGKMSTDLNSTQMSSIVTNKTSLQAGFILFIVFVLFSLVLSVILKQISPAPKKF